jgi:uncharacterized protein
MRQVGKTTLMRAVFDEIKKEPKAWFDFDNPLDQKIFEDIEYNNIYRTLKEMSGSRKKDEKIFIFIDEIQNCPKITKIIKYMIDHYGVKFFITGSSNFYLKNLFPESLSGRKFLYILNPLSFREYLYLKDKINLKQAISQSIKNIFKKRNIFEYKKFQKDYEDYLKYGGFPEVALTGDPETKKRILKNIFASFFEKDLRLISDYKDIRELRDLILLLVPRVGSMLDISKIASELGLNRPKIYNYLEFLEGTFFIKLLPKFSKSIDRSVAGGKKVYFSDTGILNILGKVNDAQLFENAVINQLKPYGDLSFYNKKNKKEIDVILDKKIAFEVKNKATLAYFKNLEKMSEKINIKKKYIISKEFTDFKNIIFPMFL